MRHDYSSPEIIKRALNIQIKEGRDAAIQFLLDNEVAVHVIIFLLPMTKVPVASPDVYRWITSVAEAHIASLTAAWQPLGSVGVEQRRAQANGALQLWAHAVGKRAFVKDRKRLEALIDGMPRVISATGT